MARLNILLINHYAGSVRHGMEYRPFYLAREWVRLGHRVRIVASSQSHIRAQAPQLDGRVRLDETIDGVDNLVDPGILPQIRIVCPHMRMGRCNDSHSMAQPAPLSS
jgi:hypothetical protein